MKSVSDSGREERRVPMKTSLISKSLMLGIALFLATGAFAAEKASLEFANRVSVGNTQLQPGEYKVQWDGNGPNVELTIIKNGSVMAKVPAKRIDVKRAAVSNTTQLKNNSDGSQSLSQIQFSGKKFAFEIGGDSVQAETVSSTK
jgi:phosphoribosylformylglycinamidine (FGAM) synthase-like enzyme